MRRRHLLVPVGLLSALVWLGCGGKARPTASSSPAPSTPAAVTVPQVAVTAGAYSAFPGTLTLPVPPAAYQSANVPTYAGTVTLSVDRSAVQGAVTLSLPAALPGGIQAQFSQTVLPSWTASAALTVQAGYSDPSDPTFATKVYPPLGTTTLPVTASTPGSPDQVLNLTLALVPEPGDFALSFLDATQAVTALTNLDLTTGAVVTEPFMAYWLRGSFAGN